MRFLLGLICFALFSQAKGYEPFLSFSASKTQLITFYSQHRVLPLSGLKYEFLDNTCSFNGVVKGLSKEGDIVIWRHLLPVDMMAQNRACMTQKLCLSTYSKRMFSGSRCCLKKSNAFKKIYTDMHNIIPTVLKEDVDNLLNSKKITYKGHIARAYLYMNHQYALKMKEKLYKMMLKWHKKFPPTTWEKALNRKIFKLQGTFNPYIEKL